MISKRLAASAKFVEGFHCLADCGTDHAYFPIYAIEHKLVQKAVASDNKKFPLENARRNVESAYLEEDIELVLADGLPYLTEKIDVVSILGLGGRSIATILEKADLTHVKRLVLSPNSEQEILRDYLEQNGFMIVGESFIKDKGKYYQIIAAQKGSMHLSDLEKEFGPFIIKEQSDEFVEFIEGLIETLNEATKHIQSQSEKETVLDRISKLKEVIS